MIRFAHVSKTYDNNASPAVHDLNLCIERGEFLVLIGPSGCGKTTTLQMINRLVEPTLGQIYLEGKDIATINPIDLRRNIGYVIQEIGLFPHMTVLQNIGVVPSLKKWSSKQIHQRVDELLEMAGMDPGIYRSRFPRELSGGQQQRIGVLRALAADPDILLMDEPFGALDPITREQLQDEIRQIHSKVKKTFVFVTHDINEALKLADKIVIMKDGEIVQIGSPDEILRKPAGDFVSNFIGKERIVRNPAEVTVDEIMLRTPAIIEPHRGLAEALERMRQKRVDSLMVVESTGKLLGVITAEDAQSHYSSHKTTCVSDIMSGISTVTKGVSVKEAAGKISSENLRFLPIVDDNGFLAGLITRGTLVDILINVLENNSGKTDWGDIHEHLE